MSVKMFRFHVGLFSFRCLVGKEAPWGQAPPTGLFRYDKTITNAFQQTQQVEPCYRTNHFLSCLFLACLLFCYNTLCFFIDATYGINKWSKIEGSWRRWTCGLVPDILTRLWTSTWFLAGFNSYTRMQPADAQKPDGLWFTPSVPFQKVSQSWWWSFSCTNDSS